MLWINGNEGFVYFSLQRIKIMPLEIELYRAIFSPKKYLKVKNYHKDWHDYERTTFELQTQENVNFPIHQNGQYVLYVFSIKDQHAGGKWLIHNAQHYLNYRQTSNISHTLVSTQM